VLEWNASAGTFFDPKPQGAVHSGDSERVAIGVPKALPKGPRKQSASYLFGGQEVKVFAVVGQTGSFSAAESPAAAFPLGKICQSTT
jgi:hypothetical protein